MRAGGFHHVALRVRDVERALRFYSGLLGLPQLRRREADGRIQAAWLDLDPGILMLERKLRGKGGRGSGHLLALSIRDLAVWTRRLTRAGIPIPDRTEATLYIQDPDGHRVGLSRFPLRGAWRRTHFSVATKTPSQSRGGGSARKRRQRSRRTRLGGSSRKPSRAARAPAKSRSQ